MNILSKLRQSLTRKQSGMNAELLPTAETEGVVESNIEGPISALQIELVQSTWKTVVPMAEQAATLFYDKLFELDPDIKLLFSRTDIEAQKKKLMQMINVAVNGLNHLDDIVPAVQELGRRHVSYGVLEEHYDTVGVALLWTLQQGLGDVFTSEVKDAWSSTYSVLADTMKAAAATPSA